MRDLSLEDVCPRGIELIEAGPGSGKTRILVSSYLERVRQKQGGVGLLSFTNVAVEEAKRRCAGEPSALRSPNYIGTFDSFVHRFIVTPSFARTHQLLPTYWPSVDDALLGSRANIRVMGVIGAGIKLSHFRFDENGSLNVSETTLDYSELGYYEKIKTSGRMELLYKLAAKAYQDLFEAGVMDAAFARYYAATVLETDSGLDLLEAIVGRFYSLLIDESQDCDAFEFSIVQRLRERGVSVLVVGDPDQAIYGFRGGSPDHFLHEKGLRPKEAIGALTINHRSNEQICLLTNTLRLTGSALVVAKDPSTVVDRPIYLLSGTVGAQRAKFIDLLNGAGISPDSSVVLAHARAYAERLSESSKVNEPSQHWVHQLIKHAAVLGRPNKSPIERWKALNAIEGLILSIVEWGGADDSRSRDVKLAILGKGRLWLRTRAVNLARSVQSDLDTKQLRTEIVRILSKISSEIPLVLRSVQHNIKTPDSDYLEKAFTFDGLPSLLLPSDTIHGAKGKEYQAVLIGLPNKLRDEGNGSVLDHWERNESSETTRTLYVAVSRPISLLAFGAGSNADRLFSLLKDRGVKAELA